jgi:hypothetical protein
MPPEQRVTKAVPIEGKASVEVRNRYGHSVDTVKKR